MNRTYRHQRHIYDFTRKYYLLGRDRLIAELDARDGARILEIGCGTGRNLIVAARKYPGARCFGIAALRQRANRIQVQVEGIARCARFLHRGGQRVQ